MLKMFTTNIFYLWGACCIIIIFFESNHETKTASYTYLGKTLVDANCPLRRQLWSPSAEHPNQASGTDSKIKTIR